MRHMAFDPPRKTSPQSTPNGNDNSRMVLAKAAAVKLIGYFPAGAPHDPDGYREGLTVILAEYPPDVMLKAIDPLKGLPSTCKFLPSPAEMKAECESWYAPIRDAYERAERERAQIAETDSLMIPDYRVKTQVLVSYRTFMEMTGGRGRPIGFFEKGPATK